jgi:hypothetical protein
MIDVVLVIVYREIVMYSKLHCDKPMSNAENTAVEATFEMYLKICSCLRVCT